MRSTSGWTPHSEGCEAVEIRLKWTARKAVDRYLGVQQLIPSDPTRAQAALALGLLDTCWLRRPRLLRLCLRWTQGNLPDAEDLLSEAWLRAMEARIDASSIRRPFSFLATIIANLGREVYSSFTR